MKQKIKNFIKNIPYIHNIIIEELQGYDDDITLTMTSGPLELTRVIDAYNKAVRKSFELREAAAKKRGFKIKESWCRKGSKNYKEVRLSMPGIKYL